MSSSAVYAVVMAAGMGARMGLSRNKALEPLSGVPMLVRSVRAFEGLVDGVVVAVRPEDEAEVRALLPGVELAYGGETRTQSVQNALAMLPEDAEIVLVHDAARPFVSREVILRCIASAREFGSGVASVPAQDTLHVAEDGWVVDTPARESLYAAQTPQAFRVEALRAALAGGGAHTDDAGAMRAAGHAVRLVEGDPMNIKLTTPSDWLLAESRLRGEARVGHGYDAHRLVSGRRLVLCGVEIPYEKGLLGHSDADVALHALMDALLGASALGDIGRHFPDTDAAYRGASSLRLLGAVRELLSERHFKVQNVDITIIAERPRLAMHIITMRERVAEALAIPVECVSVKATTTEGMGFEGEGLGVSAHAVALVEKAREGMQ